MILYAKMVIDETTAVSQPDNNVIMFDNYIWMGIGILGQDAVCYKTVIH